MAGCVAISLAAGCSRPSTSDEPEPAAMAGEMLMLAVDPITSGDTPTYAQGPARYAWLAAQCDDTPKRESLDICGRTVLGDAHYEWSECTVALPEQAPFSEITTSGSLQINTAIDGDCQAGNAALDRTASFELVRQLTEDVTMRLVGSATAQRVQPDPTTLDIVVHASREISRAGTAVATAAVDGSVSVQLDRENETRTLSGLLSMHVQHPRGAREAKLELSDVVRVHYTQCRWPVGGSITRTTDKQVSVLAFGSTCGQATLNGEPVSLAKIASYRPGGHGRRGGRPF